MEIFLKFAYLRTRAAMFFSEATRQNNRNCCVVARVSPNQLTIHFEDKKLVNFGLNES